MRATSAAADLEGFAHSAAADGKKMTEDVHALKGTRSVAEATLRKPRTIWQHVSAGFRSNGWSGPAAGDEWKAETARRLLADIWQIYASGEHSKHIYMNACFRLVCARLMQPC